MKPKVTLRKPAGYTSTRDVELGDAERASADDQACTIVASLSSEAPVARFFGAEILRHDPESVDLSRASHGLPLLLNHDADRPIGVVRELRFEAGRPVGTLAFARSRDADDIWPMVRDGFLTNMSIGYRVHEWSESENSRTATRWELFEASVAPVPADAVVGIGRSQRGAALVAALEAAMDEQIDDDTPREAVVDAMASAAGIEAGTVNQILNEEINCPPLERLEGFSEALGVDLDVLIEAAGRDGCTYDDEGRASACSTGSETMTRKVVDFENTRRQAHSEGVLEGQTRERERIAGIRELFARPRFQTEAYRALCEDLVQRGVDVDSARAELIDAIGSGTVAITDSRRDSDGAGRHYVAAGDDQLDKFREAAMQVMSVRGQIERDQQVVRDIRRNELYGYSLVDLAREYLRRGNVPVTGLTRSDLVGQAFTRAFIPGHSTSDFAAILGNTAEKAMMTGYEEAAETWEMWTRPGTLPDFKSADRVNMSGFGDLDEIPSGGEYKQGQFSDLKESIQLATYGKIFNIDRHAILNDDLAAFTDVPMKMGRAATRKVGDVAYTVLTSNPTLNQDSTALFHANHNNLAGSGAAPSVATLDTGFTAMATQKAPSPDGTADGHRVNVRPRFMLVPVALEISSRTLVMATYDPAGTAGTLKPNPFAGRLEVVADARLDADSATAWYLAAAWSELDTVEVAFLDGERRPFLDQQEGWNIDGVSYKVRLDAAAIARDFRGLYKNPG